MVTIACSRCQKVIPPGQSVNTPSGFMHLECSKPTPEIASVASVGPSGSVPTPKTQSSKSGLLVLALVVSALCNVGLLIGFGVWILVGRAAGGGSSSVPAYIYRDMDYLSQRYTMRVNPKTQQADVLFIRDGRMYWAAVEDGKLPTR